MKKINTLFAVGTLVLSAFSAFGAGRSVLEPKIIDNPDNIFTSVKRVEGVETGGGYVVVEGKRLYYGGANTLYVYDISDGPNPQLLGKVGGIGRIRQMAVWKGMVYIASRETGMWIVDARDAANPKLLSRFDTIELATGISVCGNLVMLGQRQNGVEFIDVTDPMRPAHIRIEKTNESQSTLYRDGICYSGDWSAGEVTMIDARDMRSVKTLRTVKLRGNGDGIDMQGNLLYASTGHHYHDLEAKHRRHPRKAGDPGFGEGHALEVIDISNPESPKVLGRCKFDTFYAIGQDMWMPRASGEHVFCADTYNGLYAVNAKNPAAMRIEGRVAVPDPSRNDIASMPITGVAVGDGAVYASARDCGLVIIGCPVARARKPIYEKEPANLGYRAEYKQNLDRFETWTPARRGQVRAVAPNGDYAYVACGQAGMSILRRTNGSYREVATRDVPFCGDVKIRDGRLYSAEALEGLAVYDLTDPANPRELERVTDFGTPVTCPLWLWLPKTSKLAVVSDRESGYTIMDPENKWRRVLRNGGCPGWDRYFSDEPIGGRYFAQSLANVGFAWIDISEKPPKVVRSRVNTSGLNDGCIAWKGDRLLMVSKGEFLYLQPGQAENADGSHWKGVPFVRKGEAGPTGGQPAWDGENGLALTARISKEVWKLDMSDENSPKVLWGEKVVGNPDLSAFHDGRLLVPCGYQGLLIEKANSSASAVPAVRSPTTAAKAPAKIVLVGDSTLAPRTDASPVGSWGEALAPYLREGVKIRDFAVGGRTVRTTLPTWQKTLDAIESGDFVIIQFGINDAVKAKFVPEDEFKETLEKFVREAQAKGARPILCSPLSNAGWYKTTPETAEFCLQPTRTEYGEYSRSVAKKMGVPFVGMTELTSKYLAKLGRTGALECFVGDTERDGKPVFDTTHPSKQGARNFAKLFVETCRNRKLEINEVFANSDSPKSSDAVFGEAKQVAGSFKNCMAVCLEGKTLYAGEGPFIVVYDVSDPLSPRRRGKLGGFGGVRQIAAQKGMLYVSTREFGLWIVDATDPDHLRVRSRFDCCELATGVDVAGNVCFLGQRQNGVEFIDVTDPDNPAHIAMRKTDESQSVKYRDGVLYSGDWGTGKLTVFDARDMKNIRQTACVDLWGYGDGVWMKGRYLYASTGHHAKHRDLSTLPAKGVDTAETRKYGTGGPAAGCGHGLDVFDVSEPLSPKRVGRADFPPFYQRGLDMWTSRSSGNSAYVFCAATHNGLFVVDCSDPAAPKVIDRWTSPLAGKDAWPSACVGSVAVGEGCVYVPTMGNGLFVIPAKGAAPEVFDQGRLPVNANYREPYPTDESSFRVWHPSSVGQVRGVALHGDIAYVAAGDAGFHILRLDEAKGFTELPCKRKIPKIYDVSVEGDRLYTAEGLDGWGIYRIVGDTELEEIGRVRDIGREIRLALVVSAINPRLVGLSARMGGVTLFDVTDPKNPVRQCNVQGCPGWDKYLMDSPIGDGKYLAYNSAHSCVRWIDVSANPAFVSKVTDRNRITLSNGLCKFGSDKALMTLDDGYLFLGPNEGDPEDGSLWKGKPFPGSKRFRGIPRANGNLVALTGRITRQVGLYDFKDVNNPVQLGYWKVSGNPDLAVFWKGKLIVPCGYQGLLMQR